MSHVVSIKTELTDLAAVRAACIELGLEFHEGRKNIRWYGRWVNDYDAENAAYKLGIKTEDYGKADHVISVPGCNYDIGLLKNPETGGYRLYFDFFGEGRKIQSALGDNGQWFVDHYNANKITAEMKRKGLFVHRTVNPAKRTMQLKITGAL